MKVGISFLLLLVGLVALADRPKSVENLVAAIPAPKYEIGDTLYISFIADPSVDSRHVSPSDVATRQVVLVDARIANYEGGLYLTLPVSDFPPSWEYQFLDCSLKKPKYSDRSDFYSEDRFAASPDAALKLLTNE